MDKNNIPPKYNLQQLQEYIQLMAFLQGKAPTEIRISQDAFNWYKEQRKSVGKNFNMGSIPDKDTDISFMGVKLIAIIEVK